jgi:hypothetical protein
MKRVERVWQRIERLLESGPTEDRAQKQYRICTERLKSNGEE